MSHKSGLRPRNVFKDLFKNLLETDRKINRYFTEHRLQWVQGIMTITTHLGTGAVWVAVYAFFLTFFHDRLTQLIYILVLAEAVALPFIVVLRYMTKRERPAISHHYFFLAPWNRYSFPSHHALRVFIILVVGGAVFPAFLPLLMVTAAIVCFSRIYLAKHYLSDVLAGAFLGTLLALVSQNLYERLPL